MSSNEEEKVLSKSQQKRLRKKRIATSPLEDTGRHCSKTGSASLDLVESGHYNKRKQTVSIDYSNTINTQYYDYNTMSFPQYAGQVQSPPPPPPVYGTPFPTQQVPQYASTPQTYPQIHSPPPWASELLEEMREIKEKMCKIDKIEKTVNTINVKMNGIEIQVKAMDNRINDVENACQFINSESESVKNDIKNTKTEITNLKEKCQTLQQSTNELESNKSVLESKMIELESRSMRDNLMFYGIQESEHEDCTQKVQELLEQDLQIENVKSIVFDRVHRVGARQMFKPRPIVAKFHYYSDREKVRKTAFDNTTALKSSNKGVGIQLPKQVRDTRRALWPIMKREKDLGNMDVKFVGEKLLINGQRYTGPIPQPVSTMQY